MDTLTPWHRLFGIALTDLFTGRPWRVDVEKELALKSQRLDILIIERRPGAVTDAGPAALADLPDGLERLAAHNVLTYKSQHQPLDAWALDELIGHFVTYRKLVSIERARTPAAPGAGAEPAHELVEPPRETYRLLPEDDFGLYAVATRTPERLFAQLPPGTPTATPWPGVCDLRWGGRIVRLILLGEIAAHPRNAPWEVFSARLERVRNGLSNYRSRNPHGRGLLGQLYFHYRIEVPDMAYTMEEFEHDTRRLLIAHLHEFDPDEIQAILEQIPPQERLRGLDPEELLRALDPQDRLRGLDPQERLRGLDPQERLRGLDPQERLRGLDPEELLRALDPAVVEDWLKRRGN